MMAEAVRPVAEESKSTAATGTLGTNERIALTLAGAVLAATAAIALVWSHHKLMWFDELIELQTDGVGSVREVLHIQRRVPISLDPALFHVLAHLSTRVFGVTAFGMRLPALLGFLLAQWCVFLFVRRVAGGVAGVLAMVIPACSGMLYYAAEGRPYGFLYGMDAAALLLYQSATRRTKSDRGRGLWALLGLAAVIACAVNAHWFGVLLLGPLAVAEIVRSLSRRRVDWAVVAALAGGLFGMVFALPFHAGVARYGLHYYADGTVNLHTLVQVYRVLLLGEVQVGEHVQRAVSTVFLLTMLAAAAVVWRHRRRGTIVLPLAEYTLLLAVCGLPVFGYVLAVAATHTMALRYVFGAGLAIAALLACAVGPWLRTRFAAGVAVALLLLLLAGVGWHRVDYEKRRSVLLLGRMQASPAVLQVLHQAPGGLVYMNNVFPYAASTWYAPDLTMRRRLALVYSYDDELQLRGRDTNALTADHMRAFTGFPIVDYEDLRRRGGTAIFIVSPDRWWDWTPDAFRRDGAIVQPIGPAYGGQAVAVTFVPATAATAAEDAGVQ